MAIRTMMIWLMIFSFDLYKVSADNCSECCKSLVKDDKRPKFRYKYYINTGHLIGGEGNYTIDTYGYSGRGFLIKNNPAAQCIENSGPLPQNIYTLGDCQDTMHPSRETRPCSYRLIPKDESKMCGRHSMFIHACNPCDSYYPGCDIDPEPCNYCSVGCIVITREPRKKLRKGDEIEVINFDPDYPN